MAWIESHQELGRHPKTKKLARLLGVSLPAVVGHLHFFWWWAMDYAQDGDLTRYDAEDIADACGWEGDAPQLLDGLISAGFIDQEETGLFIHDWHEYAGRLMEQRKHRNQVQARNKALYDDRELTAAIKERDGSNCRYCGREVDWKDRKSSKGATYDHVDPEGPNTIDNIVVACRGCNSAKGRRTPEQARMRLLPPGTDLKSAGNLLGRVDNQLEYLPYLTKPNQTIPNQNTTTTERPREEESENESGDSFDDLLVDDGPIRDKDDPFIQVLDAYCELHRKLDFHVKAKERDSMRSLIAAGIPHGFIIDTMRKLYEAKRQRDEEEGAPFQPPTSFTYYTNAIIEVWRIQTAPAKPLDLPPPAQGPPQRPQGRRTQQLYRPKIPVSRADAPEASDEDIERIKALAAQLKG